jgi:2-dehydropantoate 2-reductase
VTIVVVGGGAVGSFLANVLAASGASVTLVRRRARADAGRQPVGNQGDGRPRGALIVVPRLDQSGDEPDLVVVAVKAFDVASAVTDLPDWPSATLLTVQNGIGSEEVVHAGRPNNPVVAGSLTASVELAPEGEVRRRRRGGIGLARVAGQGLAIRDLVTSFNAGGLSARAYPNWRAMKWSKLIANLVGNATSALVDMPVGDVYAYPGLFEIERTQLREAFEVVRALGLKPVSLPGADVPRLELGLALPAPVGRTILGLVVGGGRGGKDPSLRIALSAKSPRTEIAWLNGAVVEHGRGAHVDTPVNRALTDLVERVSIDEELRERLRGRPDRLVDAVDEYRSVGTGPDLRAASR